MQTTRSKTNQATAPNPVTAPRRRPEASIQMMLDLRDDARTPAADNRGTCHPPAMQSSNHGATQPMKTTLNPNMPEGTSNALGQSKTPSKDMNSESSNPANTADSPLRPINRRLLGRRRLPANVHASTTTRTQPMKTNQI